MKASFLMVFRDRPGVWSVRCGNCQKVLDEDLDGLGVLLEELDILDARHECTVEQSRG